MRSGPASSACRPSASPGATARGRNFLRPAWSGWSTARTNLTTPSSTCRRLPGQHLPGLARPQRPEPLGGDSGGLERPGEVLGRLLDALVGELERAPMVPERLLGLEQLKRPHRVLRVHVL